MHLHLCNRGNETHQTNSSLRVHNTNINEDFRKCIHTLYIFIFQYKQFISVHLWCDYSIKMQTRCVAIKPCAQYMTWRSQSSPGLHSFGDNFSPFDSFAYSWHKLQAKKWSWLLIYWCIFQVLRLEIRPTVYWVEDAHWLTVANQGVSVFVFGLNKICPKEDKPRPLVWQTK